MYLRGSIVVNGKNVNAWTVFRNTAEDHTGHEQTNLNLTCCLRIRTVTFCILYVALNFNRTLIHPGQICFCWSSICSNELYKHKYHPQNLQLYTHDVLLLRSLSSSVHVTHSWGGDYNINYKCYRGQIAPVVLCSPVRYSVLSSISVCFLCFWGTDVDLSWLAGIYPTTGWWRSLPISSSYWGIYSNCEFCLHTYNPDIYIQPCVCRLITSINIW